MFKRVSALSKKTRNFAWWKNFLSYKRFRHVSGDADRNGNADRINRIYRMNEGAIFFIHFAFCHSVKKFRSLLLRSQGKRVLTEFTE